MKYTIWYRKEPTFRFDPEVRVRNLMKTHVVVHWVEAKELEEVFMKMQADEWSPNGEARPLIEELGLHHTSMSVGDVAMNEDGCFYQCDMVGWILFT